MKKNNIEHLRKMEQETEILLLNSMIDYDTLTSLALADSRDIKLMEAQTNSKKTVKMFEIRLRNIRDAIKRVENGELVI